MKKFWIYLLLVFEIFILVITLTFGSLLYLFLLFFKYTGINWTFISDFFILTPLYLGIIISIIGTIIATVRLIKNKPLNIFNKISFIGFSLTCIFICWMLLQLFQFLWYDFCMKKFFLYLLLIFQIAIFLLFFAIGSIFSMLALNFFYVSMAQSNWVIEEGSDWGFIFLFAFCGLIYLCMIIFNINSFIATVRLIKNKPLTIFNKISFLGFVLTVLLVIKFVCDI